MIVLKILFFFILLKYLLIILNTSVKFYLENMIIDFYIRKFSF